MVGADLPKKVSSMSKSTSPKKDGVFATIHRLVGEIPPGKVMTYGQIARLLEGGYSPKLVGFAMHSAPDGLPCHRVVNRLGEMAGRGMFGGEDAQRALLMSEGVPFFDNGRIDLEKALYEPDFL